MRSMLAIARPVNLNRGSAITFLNVSPHVDRSDWLALVAVRAEAFVGAPDGGCGCVHPDSLGAGDFHCLLDGPAADAAVDGRRLQRERDCGAFGPDCGSFRLRKPEFESGLDVEAIELLVEWSVLAE